jgi:hypothetical protein
MGVITILCPKTGRQVSTGIEMDQASFQAMPVKQATMRCWACGGEHGWSKRWATLAEVAPEEMELHS